MICIDHRAIVVTVYCRLCFLKYQFIGIRIIAYTVISQNVVIVVTCDSGLTNPDVIII